MKNIFNGQNPLSKVGLKDQRGITGLETAIVLIAFVVVASVFAFSVISTGLFISEKAAESASAGLGEDHPHPQGRRGSQGQPVLEVPIHGQVQDDQ